MFDISNVLVFASAFAPIVTAVVQAIKTALNIPSRYIPLVALFIGVLMGAGIQPLVQLDFVHCLWAGGISGLSSVGLFELVSRTDLPKKD